MIDSHAHIDTKAFNDDRPDMLQRAWDAGVEAIVVPDIEPVRRPHLKQVVDADPRLFRGVGVHPHHVGEITEADLRNVEAESTESKVVAIGEIGLDYYYDFCPPDVQKWAFREQLRIAKRRGLPVIIHNRESDADLLSILEEEQDGSLRGVLHCFSSGTPELRRALELGMHVSFTGNITFKNSTLDAVVSEVPLDRFMIETDSPYITPVPHRGKRNEPSYVGLVAHKIAEIKHMSVAEIISLSTTTARRLFALGVALLAIGTAAIAQPTPPRDEDYPNDYDWEIALENYYADSVAYERWIKPRSIGVGISVGSNTQVESQTFRQQYESAYEHNGSILRSEPTRWTFFDKDKGPNRSFSFEGLIAYGATLTYGLSTRFVVEGTYLYSQNTGPAEDFGLDPITTNIVELAVLYNLNPYSKVNFLPQVGATMAFVDDGLTSASDLGINFGLGIGINIPTSIGLFYPMANVRFNLMLGEKENKMVQRYTLDGEIAQPDPPIDGHPGVTSVDLADTNVLYSIPRFTLLFYPNF